MLLPVALGLTDEERTGFAFAATARRAPEQQLLDMSLLGAFRLVYADALLGPLLAPRVQALLSRWTVKD